MLRQRGRCFCRAVLRRIPECFFALSLFDSGQAGIQMNGSRAWQFPSVVRNVVLRMGVPWRIACWGTDTPVCGRLPLYGN
jgi:hypothetical protein